MNVDIGTDAAQFPEKEYINGIFLVVWAANGRKLVTRHGLTFDTIFSILTEDLGLRKMWVRRFFPIAAAVSVHV